jgi:autonomous glycyl radical cofactor GrcA
MRIKRKGGDKMMRRKKVVGLIALVAIVAAVIFAGCVEEETPVPAPLPAATPTSEPTATLTLTPIPELTPTPESIALSGTGQEATSKFSLEKGLSIFRMSHDGDSNFAIWLLDDEGDKVELLVNEIGSFDGSKAVCIKKHGDHLLDISADGRWAITIEQPRPSSAPSVPKALKGKGQQASEAFSLDKGLARFEMTHDGDSNFAIWLLDDEGDNVELLVNEIGNFDGSKAVSIRKSGIYLLDISADGNWEISIE